MTLTLGPDVMFLFSLRPPCELHSLPGVTLHRSHPSAASPHLSGSACMMHVCVLCTHTRFDPCAARCPAAAAYSVLEQHLSLSPAFLLPHSSTYAISPPIISLMYRYLHLAVCHFRVQTPASPPPPLSIRVTLHSPGLQDSPSLMLTMEHQ